MKHIKYRATFDITRERGKFIEVVILEQTHRQQSFSARRHRDIYTHDGCTLCSSSHPAADSSYYVYMQGESRNMDNLPLKFTEEQYAKFKAAVLAYNEEYK